MLLLLGIVAVFRSLWCSIPGPCLSIDTACSSSLVSSNLLFNYLRKQPDPSVTEAVSAAMINALNPGTFATWLQEGDILA